jgi:adenosylcobinamide-phosphate synthase
MSFMALLFALMLEQVRPLSERNWVHDLMRHWSHWARSIFETGRANQSGLIWGLIMGLPVLAVLAVHWILLAWLGWPLAMAWSVAVLYVTLGFRQFSHHFTQIRDALEAGEEAQARSLLASWLQVDASTLPRQELVRHVIECSAISAHRHVFGVVVWFSVLAALGLGPIGAVIYRLGMELPRWWAGVGQPQDTNSSPDGHLSEWALWAWKRIDWLPARMTAVTFAIVGNFEEAIDCWRNHAQSFPDDNDGVVLAATSGAINVRLGGEALKPRFSTELDTPMAQPSTPGLEPHLGHLRSMVGLVWRSVVMWLVLLFLLTLARLLG